MNRTELESLLRAGYASQARTVDASSVRPLPNADPTATDERVAGRVARRVWWGPLLSAAAVVIVAGIGFAVASEHTARHTSPGSPAPSAVGPTSSSPSPSSTAGHPTSPGVSSTASDLGPSRWDSHGLIITGHSLGAVAIGMSGPTAARAAGVPAFTAVGDGVLWPSTQTGTSNPLLYLGNFAGQPASKVGGGFSCIGASLSGSRGPTQTIATQAGVKLGDPASRIRQVYGAAAVYVPMPTTGGISPAAGYVVHEGEYDLVFKLSQSGDIITTIAGGLAPMTPSECNG